MGRFSTTVHIKNNADRMRFVNTFCDVMKKRGFVPCSEEEAAQSYLFAFGEGWVTLANENYRDAPQKAYDDTRDMAAALKTSAFSVEVVDSDFATLTLNNGDCVIVGDGSGYGIEEPERGTRECWEPVLANGKTWEQFSETVDKDSVFVEDTLGELAEILGIEPYYIDANSDEVLEKADSDNSVVVFYFKKAAAKAMSLNAAFVKVFGEALVPLGYKKIKGQQPYFVRIVNNEIIHIVSIAKKRHGQKIGGKTFDILCGVATIYRGEIDFNINPEDSWLQSVCDIYTKSHNNDLDMEYRASIMGFDYDTPIPHILKNVDVESTADKSEMFDSMQKALDATMRVVLPIFNDVTDLMSCEKYFSIVMQPENLSFQYKGEGLFLLKLFSSAEELCQFKESEALRELKGREIICNKAGGDFSPEIKVFEDRREERREYWLDAFNETKLLGKGAVELERRKAANTEILRSYGLEL